MATIAVLGTLDTKGTEHAFVAERIREHGHQVLLIDVGTGGPPQVTPDIPCGEHGKRHRHWHDLKVAYKPVVGVGTDPAVDAMHHL